MNEQADHPSLEMRVRHHVYQQFVETMKPPTVEEIAAVFAISVADTQKVFQYLHEQHFFFLEPGTTTVRMANPLSAVETKYRVHVGTKSYWANCAWDMLGIPAMLQQDATIKALFEDRDERIEFDVRNGRIPAGRGFVHFPFPVREWYDDLILT